MSFEGRAYSYTRSYYVALAVRAGVSLGWVATIYWLAQLDEQAFLRLPRLSLSRRLGLRWAPSYRLKLALWHLLHGRLDEATRANPLVFVVTYLASDLTWQTSRSLVQHLAMTWGMVGAQGLRPRGGPAIQHRQVHWRQGGRKPCAPTDPLRESPGTRLQSH